LKRELWATSNAFLDDTPTAIFIRQVLGTVAQLDKAMTVSSSMARRMAAVTRGELGVGEVDRRHVSAPNA
jgi:hypothetical protein